MREKTHSRAVPVSSSPGGGPIPRVESGRIVVRYREEGTVTRPVPLFAAFSLTTALSVAQGPGTDTVLEPKSKRALPVTLEVAGGSATHTLTGVAVRTKTILKVKVYKCWALFDVYLGENPIMKKGKETVAERMPAVLSG